MQRVCAWCNDEMGVAPGDSGEITHGMCERCRFHVYASRGMAIHDYLEDMDAPLVVVDGLGRVSAANRRAREMLCKDWPRIQGLPGGDVFECVHARLPEGCGNTVHCGACTVRRAVMDALETGARTDCTVTLRQAEEAGGAHLALHVSRESDGQVVLLRINSVERLEGGAAPRGE